MAVAVTGASGFLGGAILRALVADGHEVRALDMAPGTMADVRWFSGSALAAPQDAAFLAGADCLIHLAWSSKPATANQAFGDDARTNVEGSLRLLEAARDAGVKTVIFASSGGTVYGRARAAPIPEDHPLDPINAYAAGKAAFEGYLRAFCHIHAMRALVLRVSNPFGPGQYGERGQGLIATAIWRALRGLPVEVWGDGGIIRDYLFIDDAAEAFARATRHRGESDVFNIGSGVGRSIREVLAAVSLALGERIEIDQKGARPIDAPVNVLDPGKAARALGWSARTPFEEALRRTVTWARSAVG